MQPRQVMHGRRRDKLICLPKRNIIEPLPGVVEQYALNYWLRFFGIGIIAVVAKVSQVQARHNARVKALQALYQWDLSGADVNDIETHFLNSQEMGRVDLEYFRELLHGVPRQLDDIEQNLSECVDRPLEDLDPIERAICRIGAYELLERADIPVKVVINECVEVTKKFGADQGHKYVNGVMDKLAKRIRQLELSSMKKS